MMKKRFWYVVAETSELIKDKVIHREVLGEWIALFRNEQGKPSALLDRCIHRSIQLSKGTVKNGQLRCSYHGWNYNGKGEVTQIPSEGASYETQKRRCTKSFHCLEVDDYIYICLDSQPLSPEPRSMPHYKDNGYTTIRLQNTFHNNVTNCAENFVDIPHTTFVHPKIFRNPSTEKIKALVELRDSSVKVTYLGEKQNFGIFSFFLNPKNLDIQHTDEFFAPNFTTVNYWFGKKHFIITSQSVPISENKTLVYTDLTYNYGLWNFFSRPIVRRQGQAIIDQDVEILGWQMDSIQKYGDRFQNSPCDIIHTFIESIQQEIQYDRDPNLLTPKSTSIEFHI